MADVPNPVLADSPSDHNDSGIQTVIGRHNSYGFQHMLAKEMIRRFQKESRQWLDFKYVDWTF